MTMKASSMVVTVILGCSTFVATAAYTLQCASGAAASGAFQLQPPPRSSRSPTFFGGEPVCGAPGGQQRRTGGRGSTARFLVASTSEASPSSQQRGQGQGPPPRRPGGGPRRYENNFNRPNTSPAQIRLVNPMRLQRVQQAPPRQEPRRQQREGGRGRAFDRRGGGDHVEGGGGGSGPGQVLQNPRFLTRVTEQQRPQQRREREQQPMGRSAGGGGGAAAGVGVGGGGGGDDAMTDSPGKAGRRGRNVKSPRGSPGGGGGGGGDNRRYGEKRPGRVSLRVGRKSGGGGAGNRARGSLKRRDRSRERAEKEERAMERMRIVLPDAPMTVGQLAELLDEKPTAVIKYLMTDLGVMAAVSQTLDRGSCEAVVAGFGRILAGSEEDDFDEEDDYEDDDEDTALSLGFVVDEDDEADMVPRAPVVTIMGHVDHGKTSLLDAIRNTRVVAGESGGITQHIGAYQVQHEGSPITFIDTPGHAAFSDMRARGANITDIVILVVAADDGVKQQTADSIACARQAGVPLVVAVNKCDLPTADVNKVKTELTGYDILTEDLGGDVLCSEISAKEGTGLDDLLSKIMMQAELEDLKANPNRDAQGTVIEARVERGLGTVATTLIQRGTVKVGDAFVAGETSGRVRALVDTSDGTTRLDEAGPSTPVSIVGFGDGVPAAGDMFVVAEDEQTARDLAANRQRIAREKEALSYQSNLMDSVASTFSGFGAKERREMCVVVKADVQGSAEALTRSLSELRLENDEVIVTVNVLVSDVGDVTKTDVAIASVTPDTSVIAFNCAATMAAMEDARNLGIPIGYYSVVYDAIDSVESRMQEVLSPTPEGAYVGSALVQEVFNIGGTGNIAGSKCRDGFLKKGSNVRVMRGDKILTESKIRTLRNFKAEVDVINSGDECGIGLLDYEDFQPGDIIESYVEK